MSAKHVLTGRHGLTLQNSTLLGVHVGLDGQHEEQTDLFVLKLQQ